jgi:hypothetical protein
MIKGREITTAVIVLALLACLGAKADAAQCGSTAAGFEGLEARARRGGQGKRSRWLQRRGVDADELRDCHHRRRPRPKKLRSVARSVSCQARGFDHRRPRAFIEAIPGCSLRVHPATLFPQGPWMACRRGIPTWRKQFSGHSGMECRSGLSARHRADGPSDRRRRGHVRGALIPSDATPECCPSKSAAPVPFGAIWNSALRTCFTGCASKVVGTRSVL